MRKSQKSTLEMNKTVESELDFLEKRDHGAFLDFDEFVKIEFCPPGERPKLVNDVLTYITGYNFFPPQKSANDDGQEESRLPVFPSAGTDEELQNIKEFINDDKKYKAIETAFKKLWGTGDRIVPHTMNDGVPFLIEQNFTKNIGEVTGYHSEFFGKMLYLFFSNGYDKA